MGKKKKFPKMNYLSLEQVCDGRDFVIFDNCVLVSQLLSNGNGSLADVNPRYINCLSYFVEKGLPLFITESVKEQFLDRKKELDCHLRGGSFEAMWQARVRFHNIMNSKGRIIDAKAVLDDMAYFEEKMLLQKKDFYNELESTDEELITLSLFYSKTKKVALLTHDRAMLDSWRVAMKNGYSHHNFKTYRRRKQLNPCFELVKI